MKIQLETIPYSKAQSSFHFFRKETPAFHSYWHYHPELELTFIERGQGIRSVGDNLSAFQSGDLILLGENLPHDFVSSGETESDSSIAYVFQFPKTAFINIPEFYPLSPLFEEAKHGLQFTKPSPGILQKIKAAPELPPFESYLNLVSLLDDLLKHQNRSVISSVAFSGKASNQGQQYRISKVTKHILENFHRAISLKEIAEVSNMAIPSFCRWFKQSTGHSFIAYLNRARIERACQLLLQTDRFIADIAFQAGFENISHFNRIFRKIKRVTPKAYRKRMLE